MTLLVDVSALVSIGRGLVGLAVPRTFARIAGATPNAARTRLLFGVREIVVGCGLLIDSRRRGWLLARVVGDGIDVVLHAAEAMGRQRPARTFAALALVVATLIVDLGLTDAV